MARTKKTPRKGDVEKEKKVREPSKWGTAAQVAFHRPPVPPPRDGSGTYYGTAKGYPAGSEDSW